MLVHIETKEDKPKVFRAKGKKKQRKNAAWPKFKECRARVVKAQWRAEKLFVKEGERFVEHKVLNL